MENQALHDDGPFCLTRGIWLNQRRLVGKRVCNHLRSSTGSRMHLYTYPAGTPSWSRTPQGSEYIAPTFRVRRVFGTGMKTTYGSSRQWTACPKLSRYGTLLTRRLRLGTPFGIRITLLRRIHRPTRKVNRVYLSVPRHLCAQRTENVHWRRFIGDEWIIEVTVCQNRGTRWILP